MDLAVVLLGLAGLLALIALGLACYSLGAARAREEAADFFESFHERQNDG